MSQITTQELVVGTALTVSTTFTVGYVIWMLRGGMLLTSLLAQMPAWRLIDPLVVLNQAGNFEDDGEQETLETIVDSLEDRPVEPARRGGDARMNWISTRMRISIGLTCLTLSVLLLSMLIGVLPDREKAVLEGRRTLCEAIAVNSSIMVSQQDLARLQAVLKVTAERNPDILSAALRRDDGEIARRGGRSPQPVESRWTTSIPSTRRCKCRSMPAAGHRYPGRWGSVEICFRPVNQEGVMGIVLRPVVAVLVVCFRFVLRALLFLYARRCSNTSTRRRPCRGTCGPRWTPWPKGCW